jgi:hypothetical protein
MRKLLLAIVGLVALAVTSVAVAHGIEGARTATAVAGTFSATAGTVTTKSCTTSDGKSITITDGNYTGTSTGDAPLAGAITLRARSIINTTDNVGVVTGRLNIAVSGSQDTGAEFSAVYDHGSIAGLASGRGDQSAFVGNLSATFSASTGFTNGKIGGGTSGGSAVAFGSSSCNASGPTTERSEARGTISAISSTSITVAGLTCAVGSDQASNVAKFKQGDTAQIECTFANGQNTLTEIKGKSSGSGQSSGQNNSSLKSDKHGKHHHR